MELWNSDMRKKSCAQWIKLIEARCASLRGIGDFGEELADELRATTLP